MIRKLVLKLVLAALLMAWPGVLLAQGFPGSLEASLAMEGGLGLDHVTAKHGSDADPNGEAAKIASRPAFDLFDWFRVFLSSVLPL